MRRILVALLALVAFPALAASPQVKWSLVTAAAGTGTPTFNQDFTDSTTFGGGTPEFAVCWSSGTSTTDTGQAGVAFQVGMVANSVEGSIAGLGPDAQATQTTYSAGNKTTFGYHHVNSSGNVDGSANLSLIANGVRFAWTDQSVGETISCLIGDGEIQASVASLTSNNGTSAQAVTHGAGGTPDFIIALGNGMAVGDVNGNINPGIGFWTSGAEVGVSQILSSAAATTATVARISSTEAVNRIGGTTSFVYTGNISNVGATTFDVTYSANHTHVVHFLSVRSTTDTPLYVKAGTFTTKTSTGTQADVASMSGAPQVILTVGTQLTALDTGSTADPADALSIGAAVKNTGSGSTQYGSAAISDNDNTASSSAHACNQWSNTVHLKILATNCATDVAATVSSWDSGGVTHNYTANGSGVAAQVLYLAFGGTTVVAPTFSVAPTVSAQDTNDYTLSYTPSTSATFYAVACAKDSTAPTVAQVKAGNCTGDVAAIASANEAVTGADTTVLGGSLTYPIHDLYAVLSNAGGDSTLATLADEMLDAPTGYGPNALASSYTLLASVSGTSWLADLNASITPDVAAGDVVKITTTTWPSAYAWTQSTDGNGNYTDPNGSRQYLTFDIYDTSAGDWMSGGPATLWFNNSAPVANPDAYNSDDDPLIDGVAMTSIDFKTLCQDGDGDTVTGTSSDTGTGTGANKLPAGTTYVDGVWSGTPTSTGTTTGTFTSTCTDPPGDSDTVDVTWTVYDQVTVPDCDGNTLLECDAELSAVDLYGSYSVACSDVVAAGLRVSQSPIAGASANPFSTVSAVISSGSCAERKQRLNMTIKIR